MTFLSMVLPDRHRFRLAHRARFVAVGGRFHKPPAALGIAFELALAALLVYVPVFQEALGTAALPASDLAILLPMPFIVWGADELRRWYMRRRVQP